MKIEKINISDIVKTSLDQIGIVREINEKSLDWFPYKVEIIRDKIFHIEGTTEDYRKDQLTKVI